MQVYAEETCIFIYHLGVNYFHDAKMETIANIIKAIGILAFVVCTGTGIVYGVEFAASSSIKESWKFGLFFAGVGLIFGLFVLGVFITISWMMAGNPKGNHISLEETERREREFRHRHEAALRRFRESHRPYAPVSVGQAPSR